MANKLKEATICASLKENFLQQSLQELLVPKNNNKRQPLIFIFNQTNVFVPGFTSQWTSWEHLGQGAEVPSGPAFGLNLSNDV